MLFGPVRVVRDPNHGTKYLFVQGGGVVLHH